MPAYVHPDDPKFGEMLGVLMDPAYSPPEYVILNIDRGDTDAVRRLDGIADYLHLLRTASGAKVKVLGYVWTSNMYVQDGDFSNRPIEDIKRSIDHWFPEGAPPRYDGIFFDVASFICKDRDKFLTLRDYVRDRYPLATIVHNPGVAVHSCYLEPGKRTADIFATFEGSEETYFTEPEPGQLPFGSWLGGNVSHNGKYVAGDVLTFKDAQGADYDVKFGPETYWHLVHTAHAGNEARTVNLARQRKVGTLTVSTEAAGNNNPWKLEAQHAAHLRTLQQLADPPPTTTTAPPPQPAPLAARR